MHLVDPIALTADLIRCPSVTPHDHGAMAVLEGVLTKAGFYCVRVDQGGIANLFARWGAQRAAKTFGFNGHTDVVPAGDEAAWTHPPFGAVQAGGQLWGRGAADMKSGVAAFVAAAVNFVQATPPNGAIIITITGDEEGVALHGTSAILNWMKDQGERMAHCLVGEPTCPAQLGDMIKIGRRGSLTAHITAAGVQGHSAYPHRAKNPLSALVALLARLEDAPLDHGSAHFDPSTLAITTIDCGNKATNVIPAQGRATVNIRFNDLHTGGSISEWINDHCRQIEALTGVSITTDISFCDSFLTPISDFTTLIADAVAHETGRVPELSTSGGTSDARFVKDHCPVVEFGLVGQTIHQVDERVDLADITALTAIYTHILQGYFA